VKTYQKRFWMLLGTTLIVILLGLIALSIQSRPSQVKQAALPPTYTPEPIPFLDSSLEGAVLEALFPYLQEPAYHFEGGSSWLLQTVVSSGVFSATQTTLPSGEEVILDLVQAYTVMRPGKVVELPVVIGLQAAGRPYAYFSDLYFYDRLYQFDPPAYPTRQEALADARERLPRGRVFLLLAEGGVSPEGLNWEQYAQTLSGFRKYPTEICQVGESLEAAYPGQTAAFIQKSAYSFPAAWQLAGWFFQELNPGDSPDFPAQISLPSEP
jgi:hypothetical protein